MSAGSVAPIPLAFCITELDPGGAERALVNLVTGLEPQRFSAEVYSLGPPPLHSREVLVDRLQAAKIPVHFLGGTSARSAPAVLWRLRGYLRKQRPRLIQSFLFHANILGPLAARSAGVRRVVNGIRVAEREQAWHRRLELLVSPLVTAQVCVSESVRRFAEETTGLSSKRLHVIHNGIDVERFRVPPADLSQWGIPTRGEVLIFVGRLAPQKNLPMLIDATAEVLSERSETHLLIVGDGPERSAVLRRMQRYPHVADRMHLLGWRPDVPQLLAASRLLLLPSAWEGLPGAVLEAMAAGLPVVASDVEGVRELLGAASHEQLVPAGHARALANRVGQLLTAPSEAARLGEANRRRVAEQFSLDAMVRGYSELYESLLSRHP